MNTETTEYTKRWVFYDADCAICCAWAERSHGILLWNGYHLVPLQADWAKGRLGITQDEPLVEMKLLTAQGNVFGGADALIQIARAIWWAWPFYLLTEVPGVKPLLRAAYRRLAANRYCHGGKCGLPRQGAKAKGRTVSAFYELP